MYDVRERPETTRFRAFFCVFGHFFDIPVFGEIQKDTEKNSAIARAFSTFGRDVPLIVQSNLILAKTCALYSAALMA